MQNDTGSLEGGLAVSYKVKHVPHNPEISILGIYLREMKIYVYRSFIHNCQKLETTQMSLSQNITNLWCIYTVTYVIQQWRGTSLCGTGTIDESQWSYAEGKKIQGYELCVSIYRLFGEKWNYRDRKEMGFLSCGRGWVHRGRREIFVIHRIARCLDCGRWLPPKSYYYYTLKTVTPTTHKLYLTFSEQLVGHWSELANPTRDLSRACLVSLESPLPLHF